MTKCTMMIVVVAAMAITGMTATMAAHGTVAAKENLGQTAGTTFPDRNLDNRGQEDEAGLQVLALTSLTSPNSFLAEGTGIEPATPFGAPHFQCGR